MTCGNQVLSHQSQNLNLARPGTQSRQGFSSVDHFWRQCLHLCLMISAFNRKVKAGNMSFQGIEIFFLCYILD